MISELLHGKEVCTIIENMIGEGVVVKPGFRKTFPTLEDAKSFVLDQRWEVNIGFVKGSSLMREAEARAEQKRRDKR